MKKSLILWFAAVTCAALFLVGCESPTNGDAGAAGSPGSVTFSGDVTDAELARAFAKSNEVILQSTVTSVYGVIPAGKTLAVFGSVTAVKAGESLEVAGALEIEADASLDASYVGGAAGYLKGTASGVKGAGTVKLPYVGTGGSLPAGGIGYADGVAAVKAAGSYITTAGEGSALDSDGIAAIFTASPEIEALTVSDIIGLSAAAVPAEKTLTLTGDGNTVTGNLNLSAGKGTLIVDGTLEVSSGVTITGASAAANITVNGTLKLASAGTTFAIAGKVDLSAATIDATEAGVATLTLPGEAATVGEISVGSSNALTIAGATALTVESIGPQNGKGVKSNSVMTYAVKSGGSVGLAAGTDTFIVKQAGIVNGTTDTEFVLDDTTKITIGSALTITNAVLKAGTTNGISIAAGVAPDTNYALTTENLAKLQGKVTYTGAVTGIGETLVVPAGLELDVSTAGTLATITGLTVNGTLTASKATLAAATAINIGNGGVLDIGDNSAFTTAQGSLVITSTGTGKVVSTTTTATVLQALLSKAGATLNIEQGDAVTLSAASTVKAGTVLTLVESGSLMADNTAAKKLTVAGKVVLDGGTLATGTTTTDGTDPAITITGTGRIEAGGVVISGAGALWDATGSNAKAISITKAAGFAGAVNGKITLKGATAINAGDGKVILAVDGGDDDATATGTFLSAAANGQLTVTADEDSATVALDGGSTAVAAALTIGKKGSLTVAAGGIIKIKGVTSTLFSASSESTAKFVIAAGAKLAVDSTATGETAAFTTSTGVFSNTGTFATDSVGTYVGDNSGKWTKQ